MSKQMSFHFTTVAYLTCKAIINNINFGKRVTESVAACTEDPIMASIFEDTARTTLQEQLGEEKNMSHQLYVCNNNNN